MGGRQGLFGRLPCAPEPMPGRCGWDTREFVMEAMRCRGDSEVPLPPPPPAAAAAATAAATAGSGAASMEPMAGKRGPGLFPGGKRRGKSDYQLNLSLSAVFVLQRIIEVKVRKVIYYSRATELSYKFIETLSLGPIILSHALGPTVSITDSWPQIMSIREIVQKCSFWSRTC